MLPTTIVVEQWIALLCFFLMPPVPSATIYNISWVSTNPMFSGRNIPNFTENLKMSDRIRFSCSPNGTERTAIHRVDKDAALNCRIQTKFMDSLVGTCTKANDSVIIRLREIPLLPNEMSYKADHDYFFITTSTGEENGMENVDGGLCRTNNMRLKIRVKSKSTGIPQKVPEITPRMNSGPVVMIPVNSGQYAVPVVYIPVAPSSKVNDDDKKGQTFPYHLYFSNGQLRAANSNMDDLGRAGVGALSYPYKNLGAVSGDDGVLQESQFDAGDQPKDFKKPASATDSNRYVAPLMEKDIDFEIEYVDSATKRSYKILTMGIAISSCILVANILL